jgi:hypothetical protein
MASIRITNFRGMIPKLAPQLLPEGFASDAVDCRFMAGELRPEFADVTAETLQTSNPKTIYPYRGQWLEWANRVSIIASPVYEDQYTRIYYTGDGTPKVRSVLDETESVRRIGISAPTQKPSVSREGGPPDPDYVTSRAYCYTYVSPFGEEGPPSPPSENVDVSPATEYVKVSGFVQLVDPDMPIEKYRIYRTVTGSEGTEYQFVADIPADSGAVYDDHLLDEETGDVLPSDNWYPPVDGLSGICLCPGGFAVGFAGKDVYFSVTALPHAWPAAWAVPMPDDIVAVAPMGNSVIVMTVRGTFLVTGSSQDSMSVAQIAGNLPCISAASVVAAAGMVFYASPDGLVGVNGTEATLMTKHLYDRQDWQALNPDTLLSHFWDNCYYGFTDTAAFAIDFSSDRPDVARLSISPSAVYVDDFADRFYYAYGTELRYIGVGGTRKGATWTSRLTMFPREVAFAWVRVQAEAYPLALRAEGEHGAAIELVIYDNRARRAQAVRAQKNWTIGVYTNVPVQELAMAETLEEIAG